MTDANTDSPPSRSSRPRLTLTVGGLVLIAVMIAMLPLIVRRVGDADYWWHITTARWILDNHALPTHDLFTYTVPSHVWTDHEYLTELAMYGLGRLGGQLAISIGLGLVTWAGFWFILKRITVQPTHFVATAGALGLAALAGVAVWGPRPQVVTFALVCVELYLIERFLRTGYRGLYAMPLIMVGWANLHGGFVIAFLFLGIAVAVEVLRWLFDRANAEARWKAGRIALVTLAAAAAGLLNPHFFSLYAYSWRTQTSTVQQSFIEEWQSPDFHSWSMRAFEAMIVLLLIGLALRRVRPTCFSVAITVVTLLLALQSWRHIILFTAAATPLLAWSWGPTLEELERRWSRAGARLRLSAQHLVRGAALATAAVALAVLVVLRSLLAHQAASTLDNYPAGAADYLDAHPNVGTHMFSDYAWGGYFIYRFYPEPSRRVFIFGEADLMGDTIMNQYVEVVGLRSDWMDVLNSHNVDYVVFAPNRPLTSALAASPNWHLVYSDKLSVIYVRG